MPDILIRGVDDRAIKRLKVRAKQHGRSLQSEVRMVIEQAAGAGTEEVAAMLEGWKRRFAGRKFSRSASLIREDRER